MSTVVVRVQWQDGDALSESVYGPFRDRDKAQAFAEKVIARAEKSQAEDDANYLQADVLYVAKPLLRKVYEEYDL